ncbi:helix-turn-helix domain-containing protein [Chloroflexi bacterium CFX6]|jgi:excisionase family DNA binding protein|nr:helix-turn-helix domain-containing protein [Chloroflexi bacterium CFX6]GER78946.1 DNA-binding protein [Candidatus Denitrolinea symbiosum]
MEDWLTTYEAARVSGYNPDYIRQLIRSQKVRGRKWGLSWQVSRRSLEEYVKKAEKLGERRGAKPRPGSKRR